MAEDQLKQTLTVAWGNYLPVRLDQEDVRRVCIAVGIAERATEELKRKKTRLEQVHWEFNNDASDDRQLDLNDEMTILYNEIETLEGILNG